MEIDVEIKRILKALIVLKVMAMKMSSGVAVKMMTWLIMKVSLMKVT